MQAVQMNVRMDAPLKAAGDAVAVQCGWTPTQLVRALWEYLAVHERPPRELAAVLERDRAGAADSEGAEERALEGRAIVDSFYERFGYPKPAVERLDYEVLRAGGAREQLEDWGLA